ncbi:porin family protein [uncultured Muribaculum sp.]|uniref:porin family protein n=1 Tax=uncultured Muribaculum sp. TaxID=1918613 RepID=UPI0025919DCB|nr:porin family protein [uncultured Muribaculum sp.]
MRKKILCLAIFSVLFCAFESSAQFRWGPMLGLDITNLKYKQDLISIDRSTGFSAGVVTELMFPGIGFGISSGLYYEQKGATLNLGEKVIWESQGYGKERSYLHYVTLPIHLRFKWTRMSGLEDYVAPFVYGGPTFGILVGHSHVRALRYAGGDVGLSVGGGFEVMRKWQISCSYTWGLTYAEKTRLLDDFSGKNRALSIQVSYLF